ncbi:MAG: hypothetical protein WKG03_12170 [Telluria sp.]
MWRTSLFFLGAAWLVCAQALGQAPAVAYDAELAKSAGGNDNGMRSYVLVVLKTGPTKVTDPAARTKMFEGHMANIHRLAAEKKLVLAGPLDGVDGWRGMFVFATPDIEVAKTYVATDPVIISGDMVAEYHKLFASAGLMLVNEIHNKIQKKK